MVAVRKLLEQQQAKKQYEYLTFHCDWALHGRSEGATAQKILRLFDRASIHLKKGVELHDLPDLLRTDIDRISKMRYFEDQLEQFFKNKRACFLADDALRWMDSLPPSVFKDS